VVNEISLRWIVRNKPSSIFYENNFEETVLTYKIVIVSYCISSILLPNSIVEVIQKMIL